MFKNCNLLKSKIVLSGFNLGSFANKINVSATTLRKRLSEPSTFKLDEVKSIAEVLKLTPEEVVSIFLNY